MHISFVAEKIFSIFGFPVTNSLLMTWIGMIVLIILGVLAARNPKTLPGKIQNAAEAIIEYFYNLAQSILQDNALTAKVFPIVFSFFLFIVLSNWLGLVPGVGPIGIFHEVHGERILTPLFRPANADINTTLSWAIISIVVTQFFGIAALGFFTHARKYINFKNLLTFKFEGIINFFVGILEAFLELSRVISFAFRLFGNVFAGEVLLTVIAFLIPYIAPLPFYFLELFVGLIQGLVFAILTLVFIRIGTMSHDHNDNHKTGHQEMVTAHSH
jgi:F-type H+-transporting ATPase subunit a